MYQSLTDPSKYVIFKPTEEDEKYAINLENNEKVPKEELQIENLYKKINDDVIENLDKYTECLDLVIE